jgi:hypothetical protein
MVPESKVTRRTFLHAVLGVGATGILASCGGTASRSQLTPTPLTRVSTPTAAQASSVATPAVKTSSKLDVLRVDYAYYNPVSLVLKRQGWVEQEFSRDGTRVEWVLSLGSNKANEFTASGTVHFGSTAGSAALLARANGVPLKTVWIYAQRSGQLWLSAVMGRSVRRVTSKARKLQRRVALIRGSSSSARLIASDSRRTILRSCNSSIRMVSKRSCAATLMHGPASIRIWHMLS